MGQWMIYATVLGSVLLFGGAAVWALAWAVRDGQFDDFHAGARSIFDADEPVGQPTDQILRRDRGEGDHG